LNYSRKVSAALILLILISGCSLSQASIEAGDTVTVNYVGMMESGKVFDTSIGEVATDASMPKTDFFKLRDSYSPIPLEVGTGQLIPGFEEAILGMKVGEKKEFTVPPEKGYGSWSEEKTSTESRTTYIDVIENANRSMARLGSRDSHRYRELSDNKKSHI
jgi:FKBP-type peptidyl-prolyl cis-trans isomerase 2